MLKMQKDELQSKINQLENMQSECYRIKLNQEESTLNIASK